MTLSSIALIGVPAATADEQQTTAEQNTAAKPSVIINEVYAGNTKAAGDPDSKRCDWAELKNTGSTDVDVKGWGIWWHTSTPTRQSLPKPAMPLPI